MTATDALKEMLWNWIKTESTIRDAYPNASDEIVYQLTSSAMNKSLGL